MAKKPSSNRSRQSKKLHTSRQTFSGKAKEVKSKFPHISRIISRISVASFFIALTTFLFVSIEKEHDKIYLSLKQQVLQKPSSADSHQQLGEYFEGLNDFHRAKQEYSLAQLFGSDNVAAIFQRMREKQQEPLVIHEAIGEWQQFLKDHPEYRDGWMVVALLAWQVGDTEKLTVALNQTLSLDPMYAPAKQLYERMPKE